MVLYATESLRSPPLRNIKDKVEGYHSVLQPKSQSKQDSSHPEVQKRLPGTDCGFDAQL